MTHFLIGFIIGGIIGIIIEAILIVGSSKENK